MTAALTINGITAPVSVAGFKEGEIAIEDRGRALSGKALSTRRALKRTFSGELITTDATEADALRGFINGDGYGFSFAADLRDDYKGNQGFTTTHAAREAGGKFSAGQMTVDSNYTTAFTFPTAWPGTTWTAAFWRKETTNGTWEHWVKMYGTSTLWKDGVAGTSLPAWMTFNTTGFTLAGHASGNSKYSEMLIVPHLWPSTWPAIIAARATANYKAPFVELGGTLVTPACTSNFRGQALSSSMANRGALDPLRRVDFSLEEE